MEIRDYLALKTIDGYTLRKFVDGTAVLMSGERRLCNGRVCSAREFSDRSATDDAYSLMIRGMFITRKGNRYLYVLDLNEQEMLFVPVEEVSK